MKLTKSENSFSFKNLNILLFIGLSFGS